jgi:threonine-phosphate decarboxylase
MYKNECAGKTQPNTDRYLRIASRTETENCNLVAALIDVMNGKTEEA